MNLKSAPPLPNAPVVRPTDMALIIKGNNAELMPWGLRVDWSKQPMINARSETLEEKPTFRSLLHNRCIVPASTYFEWRKNKHQQSCINMIKPAYFPVFGFAGLHDGERFTIITCTPSKSIAHIHSRMPVILEPDTFDAWMSNAPFPDVKNYLKPFEGEMSFEEEEPDPPAQADLFG